MNYKERLDRLSEGLPSDVIKRMDGLVDRSDLDKLKRYAVDIKLDLGKEFELKDVDEYLKYKLHL